MKIFIHAHYYFPKTMAGAEKYLHEIAKYLIAHGHKVTASSDDAGEYIYDGVGVVSNKNGIEENYVWADAVITHLNYAGQDLINPSFIYCTIMILQANYLMLLQTILLSITATTYALN
jgi:hypothetical protein